MNLEGKKILVTGGTGSFGKHFVEILLKEYNPKVIRILSRDEFKQHIMYQQFKGDERLRFFIGDIRDAERVGLAMQGVDIVVHAAALKHVPICEYNPFEAIKTNIIGTQNIICAALECEVSKVMTISSDKAVNPINLYGATKLCAEKLTIQGNCYAGFKNTVFSSCRYGNVLGSRGSVVDMFKEQKEKGELTITDKRMTRFWLTLDQGVRFVISNIERMVGTEVFVPKIPSMSILQLAQSIAPGVPIKEIGRRPGEKIHEVLISKDESQNTLEFPDCYVVIPSFTKKHMKSYLVEGKPVCEDFEYTSHTNNQWLTPDKLNKLVQSA